MQNTKIILLNSSFSFLVVFVDGGYGRQSSFVHGAADFWQ